MTLLIVLSLLGAAVTAAILQAAKTWLAVPDNSYAGLVPWMAAWILAPLTILALVIAAIEFAVKRKSIAIKWALGLLAAFMGAWAGNAAAVGIRRVLGLTYVTPPAP